MSSHRNALADQPSPYLRQHAHNPVAWLPWGDKALAQARGADKPILLSIGYSACHWCHVMAHESFEDEATAKVLNRLFVNIKVDREERPDLDKIYQTAHQLMHRRGGGWPLTVFLDPHDLMPIFTGTYFPPEPRHGLPGFVQLCEYIAEVYRDRKEDLQMQSASIAEVLERVERGPEIAEQLPGIETFAAARNELAGMYDAARGGFGGAPKFPQPTLLRALLGPCRAEGGAEMARNTLYRMALGGLQDQLGGGFYRYSVDGHWMIPHFEKMLYDNAQLLPLYAQVARETGDPLFHDAAGGIVRWLQREMAAPGGGWYSALDADSEGHEGLFYLWTAEELTTHLDADTLAQATEVFRLDGEPNFEGRFHFHRYDEGETDQAFLARLRAALMPVREQRIRPGLDNKVLSAWNGLLAAGLARAGMLLDQPDWIDLAANTIDFLRDTQWRNGRLFAACKEGRPYLNGYLDDHAFALDATMALLQARWRSRDLAFAIALADTLLALFEDHPHGGFFFTAHDHEPLITRPKPFSDDAVPSGNGMALQALHTLGHLLGDTRYLDAVERALHAAGALLEQAPSAHASVLLAHAAYLAPPTQVVVRSGEVTAREVRTALDETGFAGDLFVIPDAEAALPGGLQAMVPQGTFTAYVCRNHSCSAPLGSLAGLRDLIAKTEKDPR